MVNDMSNIDPYKVSDKDREKVLDFTKKVRRSEDELEKVKVDDSKSRGRRRR